MKKVSGVRGQSRDTRELPRGRWMYFFVIVSIVVVFCSDYMVKETNNHTCCDILNSKAAESKSGFTNQHIVR